MPNHASELCRKFSVRVFTRSSSSNDDYTPRFVVIVVRAELRISEGQAHRVMMTARKGGTRVVAVYTKDIAECKATGGTVAGRRKWGIRCCSRQSQRNRLAPVRTAEGKDGQAGSVCISANCDG